MISLGIIFSAIILGKVIIAFLLNRIFNQVARRTETEIDDELVKAVQTPEYLMLLARLVEFALTRLALLKVRFGW
ncbi:MAG: hypothetical protein JXA19_03150 [Anaerolineales bacterium]|nr:hypothetical protein [Anaerolineales bacterium]